MADEWTLTALLARAGVSPMSGQSHRDIPITTITDDSRKAEPGALFVAVRGIKSDGHHYIDAAVSAGSVAVVVDRDVPVPPGVVEVRVPDSREALARLAAAYYGLRGDGGGGPRLIGITGTNGKTTVAWILRSILRAAGYRVALLGTVEYELSGRRMSAPLTTPAPLELCRHLAAARDAGADYAVMEASSHALDQRRTDGLTFAAGVFTNLSGDHLDYHGSMESYWRAKRRLFELLPADAVAVVNRDDPVADLMVANIAARVVSFGIDAVGADSRAIVKTIDSSGCVFTLRGPTVEVPVRSALVGRHNVANALAAATTAEACGISVDAICAGIEQLLAVPGRLQRVEPEGCPFSVFVDYAHTDDALRNVLQTLKTLTSGRLICVFGCGGNRDHSKRPRMAEVVGQIADLAFVTSDNPRTEDPRQIIEEMLPGFRSTPRCRVEVQVDRRRAIEAAISQAQPGDTVLVAGKGHEDYQLIGDKVLHFDDVEVARACLDPAPAAGATR
ncbi:MAG: UDP-N-acetylmuramoyl-L-alanyl-D-glutamate--2,6-diaminopimelate ligase [Planctomycetes bacterium]|nr:UDP-N-acetylmuramoyl-L-alanyl-D-glutamate--2,6-diaminopimelate ligase [Planctomycetota bacterium]